MNPLKLVMTTAGLGRFTAAQANDDIDLTVATVGFSDAVFVAAPTLTALPGEFRRVATVSGSVEAQNIVHLTVTDAEPLTYSVRGFGLFLADGTLFAAYSQATPIVEKALGSMLGLAIDLAFPIAGVEDISFGSTDFLNPPATEARRGVVELATLAEAQAGDAVRATTGAVVLALISDAVSTAIDAVTQAIDGILGRTIFGSGLVKGGGDLTANRTLTVDAATADQLRIGTATDVAVTPAALGALASAFGDTGEWEVPGGIAVKLGVYNGTIAAGAVPIAFTTAFANECRGVFFTPINSTGDDRRDPYLQLQSKNAAGFTGYVQKSGSDGTDIDGFLWLAIGR